MDIVITAWALDSYLEMKHKKVFSDDEYQNTIRPDVLLMGKYPGDPKFNGNKFWSIATDRSGNRVPGGFKMKWHQVGSGNVQLRLPIGVMNECYLCEAYVKRDDKLEKRKIARFKTHLELIRRGTFTECGRLR